MRLRGAAHRDYNIIKSMFDEYKFELDYPHIESMIVIENNNGEVIAAGSLTCILEAAFVTDIKHSRKERVEALKMLLAQAEKESISLGYKSYHAFTTNEMILAILKKKFKFVPTKALEVLVKWVGE